MPRPEYTGYHPEINGLLNELSDLKDSAQLRANDLLRDDESRVRAQATADTYAYVMLRLTQLNV